MHTPVLLKEALDGLNIKKNGLYIDATSGEGGHLMEIAVRGGKILAVDGDGEQINNLKLKLFAGSRQTPAGIKNLAGIKLVKGNFADIETIARSNKFCPVDGILFDLGLSMTQIQSSGRGFSYKNLQEPLDMRLDTESDTTALNIINSFSQDELYEIFAHYGEEINSLAISKALVRTRSLNKIGKVGDLIRVIDRVLGFKDKKTYARIFQALRIAVNDETENLKLALEGCLKILKDKGRIVVISFHSLEDRIVKQFINQHRLTQLNKKVTRSKRDFTFERSAKLRIIIYEKSN